MLLEHFLPSFGLRSLYFGGMPHLDSLKHKYAVRKPEQRMSPCRKSLHASTHLLVEQRAIASLSASFAVVKMRVVA